ncbi:MAG: hypothetical protein LBQ60_04040 [Bacteroidales bacterium]|jgi:hypothetical protein|nr:hypothetical protein [Bacteroidales bacterium]
MKFSIATLLSILLSGIMYGQLPEHEATRSIKQEAGRIKELPQKDAVRSIQQSTGRMKQFTRKNDRRTKKSRKRMQRYEKRLSKDMDSIPAPLAAPIDVSTDAGLGNEPHLDNLKNAYQFSGQTQIAPPSQVQEGLSGIDKTKQSIHASSQMKNQLHQRTGNWKQCAKGTARNQRIIKKMEKESYYYTAEVNKYRQIIRDPSTLDQQLTDALKQHPQWSSFMASLPAKPQDPEKMQPKEMIRQMMQSQAGSIDPNATQLIKDAQSKGSELLGTLSGGEGGNIDNASQLPGFVPNPYKTKSFWERVDVGFDLQFNKNTYHLPSSGTAGIQIGYHISRKISTGITGSYRFGLGEDIRHIRFSHAGAGYGVFFNYLIKWGFGVQPGFERNWRSSIDTKDGQHFKSAWRSALLLGITKEYRIGKKAKGNVAVFYDFLHKRQVPHSNAFLWKMGWKF